MGMPIQRFSNLSIEKNRLLVKERITSFKMTPKKEFFQTYFIPVNYHSIPHCMICSEESVLGAHELHNIIHPQLTLDQQDREHVYPAPRESAAAFILYKTYSIEITEERRQCETWQRAIRNRWKADTCQFTSVWVLLALFMWMQLYTPLCTMA